MQSRDQFDDPTWEFVCRERAIESLHQLDMNQRLEVIFKFHITKDELQLAMDNREDVLQDTQAALKKLARKHNFASSNWFDFENQGPDQQRKRIIDSVLSNLSNKIPFYREEIVWDHKISDKQLKSALSRPQYIRTVRDIKERARRVNQSLLWFIPLEFHTIESLFTKEAKHNAKVIVSDESYIPVTVNDDRNTVLGKLLRMALPTSIKAIFDYKITHKELQEQLIKSRGKIEAKYSLGDIVPIVRIISALQKIPISFFVQRHYTPDEAKIALQKLSTDCSPGETIWIFKFTYNQLCKNYSPELVAHFVEDFRVYRQKANIYQKDLAFFQAPHLDLSPLKCRTDQIQSDVYEEERGDITPPRSPRYLPVEARSIARRRIAVRTLGSMQVDDQAKNIVEHKIKYQEIKNVLGETANLQTLFDVIRDLLEEKGLSSNDYAFIERELPEPEAAGVNYDEERSPDIDSQIAELVALDNTGMSGEELWEKIKGFPPAVLERYIAKNQKNTKHDKA